MAEGGNGDDRNWSMWLRLLSHSVRDTAGSASADDTTVLQAVRVGFFLLDSHIICCGVCGKRRLGKDDELGHRSNFFR